MKQIIVKASKNQTVRLLAVFIVGLAVGAIFYPSKSIKEEERQRYEARIEKEIQYSRTLEKQYQEKIAEESKESRKREEQLRATITSQKTEISKLQAKVSERTFKIVRPDGTIEEKTFKESEINKDTSVVSTIRAEFDRKVTEIEDRWKKVYTERLLVIKDQTDAKLKEKDHRIAELERSRTVEINKRNFGVSVGMTNKKDYYGTVHRDVAGPIFIQGLIQTNPDNNDSRGGIGIGLSF